MKYDLSKMRMMVVDDSDFMRHVVCKILRRLEVGTVTEATNGEDALAQFSQGQPNVIFTDWIMQPVSGMELLQVIRAGKTPIEPKTPLIMMTSQLEPAQVLAARQAGVSGYLAKPVAVKAILNQLSIVLKMPDIAFEPKPADVQRQILGPRRAR